jgi:DNA-directed RNA polymerase subunit RPC12/RpoP
MRRHLSGGNSPHDRAGCIQGNTPRQGKAYNIGVHDETATNRGDRAIMATQVRNSENVIDFRLVSNYYVIDCECGFRALVIKRKYADKRIARVLTGHACETEKGQG